MDPVSLVQLWMAVRPFHRLKLRREARQAAEAGATPLPEPATDHPPEHVDAAVKVAAFLVGSAKSKLIWLAVGQLGYALFQLWVNDGTITAASAEPALGAALTAIFRIATSQSLTDKGAA